jgi:SAM-dependent methyltransferase
VTSGLEYSRGVSNWRKRVDAPTARERATCARTSSRGRFRSGAFDTIMAPEVLEHVPDPAAALRECARLLFPLLDPPTRLRAIAGMRRSEFASFVGDDLIVASR